MSSFPIRVARKFSREVRSPYDALTFFWRLLLPVDPHVREGHSWMWGKLPRVELNDILSGIEDTEVLILEAHGRNRVRRWSLSTEELADLLAIVKSTKAKKILEIGTFDGGTALNLAANAPSDGQIVTVDLPPNWRGNLSIKTPEDYQDISDRKIVGVRFLGTPYQEKITQIFDDSASMDWSKLPIPFDIVFIDGCHYYDYVASDTQNALKCVRPGGLVIWHDYGFYKDVSDVVDSFATKMKVRVIAGTRLAVGFPGISP